MSLNVPKAYEFTPAPVGEVKLISRSSRRARTRAGGTYFRSIQYGEAVNDIKLGVIIDGSEGVMYTKYGLTADFDVLVSNLAWDEELRCTKNADSSVSAHVLGIRWQIAGGPPEVLRYSVSSSVGRTCRINGTVFVVPDMLVGETKVVKPTVRKYALSKETLTNPDTGLPETDWSITALRTLVNADSSAHVYMPSRPSPVNTVLNEDVQDDGTDTLFLSAFAETSMTGGDGLPLTPVQINTGPDRALVHLNYAEQDDGSLGVINRVFEWDGRTALSGAWAMYS